MVEERECIQDYCLPKCPTYQVISITKQEEDPSKFSALFSVQKASYPIGELQYQTLRLNSNYSLDDSHWLYLKATDFDTSTKQAYVTMRNLLRNVTYLPIYEFHLSLTSTDMKNLTKIAWECKGQVSYHLNTI